MHSRELAFGNEFDPHPQWRAIKTSF